MRRLTRVLSWMISIAILGMLGIYLAQARLLRHSPPSPEPEILNNGWHRYTDKDAGYAISYPADVRFILSRDRALEFPQVHFLLPPSTGRGNQWMTILVLRNPEKLPPLQFITQDIRETFRGYETMHVFPKTVYLGSQEAFQVDISPFLPGVYIFHRDKVYFLALHADMLSGLPPTPGARAMFFKIADTFTLLEDQEK